MAIYMVSGFPVLMCNLRGVLIFSPRYGTVYLFLQLLPPLSMLFLLTSAVSSALWAADLEVERRQHEGQISGAEEYRDDAEEAV